MIFDFFARTNLLPCELVFEGTIATPKGWFAAAAALGGMIAVRDQLTGRPMLVANDVFEQHLAAGTIPHGTSYQ